MTENGSGLTLGWSGTPQYIKKNLNVMRMVNYSISKVTLKSARNGVKEWNEEPEGPKSRVQESSQEKQ